MAGSKAGDARPLRQLRTIMSVVTAFFVRLLLARLALAAAQIPAQLLGQPFRAFVLVRHRATVPFSGRSAKPMLDKLLTAAASPFSIIHLYSIPRPGHGSTTMGCVNVHNAMLHLKAVGFQEASG